MKSWFVVYTKPLKEEYAKWNLENMGYETLLPICLKTKNGNRRALPLFPRYLFVNFDPKKDTRWLIRNCRGVTRLVSFYPDGLPSSVPERFINDIKLRLDKDGYVRLETLASRLKAGDRVEIGDGPFSGYQGLFLESLNGRDRILILLNIIHNSVKISIPSGLVNKI